jgi:hypothetical protein
MPARNDHPLTRQVIGERRAGWAIAGEALDAGGPRDRLHRHQLVLGRRAFQFFALQLELLEQASATLGALAEPLAPQLLDLQLKMGDQCLVVGRLGRSVAASAGAVASSSPRASSTASVPRFRQEGVREGAGSHPH